MGDGAAVRNTRGRLHNQLKLLQWRYAPPGMLTTRWLSFVGPLKTLSKEKTPPREFQCLRLYQINKRRSVKVAYV
jgi:hypothetical protein